MSKLNYSKNTLWWLASFIIMSALIFFDFYVYSEISKWFIFVWMYNANFFVYSLINNGRLLINQDKKNRSSILIDFHNSLSFMKFIMIIGVVWLELAELINGYVYVWVMTILSLDIVMLIYRIRISKKEAYK